MPNISWIARNRTLATAGASAITVPFAAWAGFSAISHFVFHRSNFSTASEMYFRLTSNRRRLADPIAFDNFLLGRAKKNEQIVDVPEHMPFKVSVESLDNEGMHTFLLNRRDRNDRAVIYLHGGEYLLQPSTYHWKFVDTIARRTRAEIFFPQYPLAPVHTHEEAYEKIIALYRSVAEEYGPRNVTLMGDDVGATLAVGLAQQLEELGLEQPSHLILISPWADITLHNPRVDEFEAVDPLLAAYGMRKVGTLWAHGADPTDPKLSPVNGEVRMLRNVMMFVGTRELLYPDARLLFDRIQATGTHAHLVEGRGLNHNFPLYPTPEASHAIDRIVDAVTED